MMLHNNDVKIKANAFTQCCCNLYLFVCHENNLCSKWDSAQNDTFNFYSKMQSSLSYLSIGFTLDAVMFFTSCIILHSFVNKCCFYFMAILYIFETCIFSITHSKLAPRAILSWIELKLHLRICTYKLGSKELQKSGNTLLPSAYYDAQIFWLHFLERKTYLLLFLTWHF